MTPEKRKRAVKWLTEEIRSLRMAPKINGCGPENWEDQLEIMETCLEAVRNCNEVANGLQSGTRSVTESEVMNRPFVRDITTVCGCCCTDGNHDVDGNKMVPLTLEQLREKVGQPVVIKYSYGGPYTFVIVDVRYVPHLGADKIRLVFPDGYITVNERDYGTYFTTYAYPPAHIDREAWEPCGELCRNNCMTCDHNADELFGDEDYCKDCHRYSKWESSVHKYCERCGRPKTPDAWAELEKRLRG